MPSVKNPNKASKNRLAARANKTRKLRQQQSEAGKAGVVKAADKRCGARTGLMPTSGPRKPVSSKKQRKLERKMGYALKRKMEADGEVVMKDSSAVDASKQDPEAKAEEKMEVDDIS